MFQAVHTSPSQCLDVNAVRILFFFYTIIALFEIIHILQWRTWGGLSPRECPYTGEGRGMSPYSTSNTSKRRTVDNNQQVQLGNL